MRRIRIFTVLLLVVLIAGIFRCGVGTEQVEEAGAGRAAAVRHQVTNQAQIDSGQSTVVARGRYLANAGNCVSCHTVTGSTPFAGGVAFETAFGTIYSTNITPDPETGIGQWTLQDFRRAMREGIAPGGRFLFPAFPYTAFTKLSDPDIEAIYTYLRSLKPERRSEQPSNSLFFRLRWGALWNARFFEPGPMLDDPTQSAEWNRGAYLIEALAHCSACHTPRNRFLAEDDTRRYAGGVIYDSVAPGKVRRWSAVNITQHKTGLAKWSVEDIRQYLGKGANRWAGSFGPMNEVLVNSTMKLSEDDLHAMATYLKSLPARAVTTAAEPARADPMGKTLYEEHCEECHMTSGRGGMFDAPPLAGSTVVQSHAPFSLINVILYGPRTSNEVSYGAWETMKGYGDVLSDTELAALANYVRASWKNVGVSVDPADVARQR